MKIIKNIMYITLIILLILISFNNVSLSYTSPEQIITNDGGSADPNAGGSDPITDPDYFNPNSAIMGGNAKFLEKANIVLSIIQVLGTVISVITLMAIGIKYMLGSASEKAQFKETMIPYIIGAIMLFALPHFLAVILDLVSSIKF